MEGSFENKFENSTFSEGNERYPQFGITENKDEWPNPAESRNNYERLISKLDS